MGALTEGRRATALLAAVSLCLAACGGEEAAPAGTHEPAVSGIPEAAAAEAVVVGAGLAGLSAAVEMGRRGLEVIVVDMNSVPGGHAVRAGGVALVDTPVQRAAGIEDSPDLAYRDWMAWTVDGDPYWTRFYAENSRAMIYDWLAGMGVEFVRAAPGHGNSVPRFHFTRGRAVHIVLPLYREALNLPGVRFLWNTRATALLAEGGAVRGVQIKDLRSGEERTLRTPNVVLATGGFESDLDRVLANWIPELPRPQRLMVGTSVRATGSGHDLALEAGAGMNRLDRHYIYVNGLPDPRDPAGRHALTAGNDLAVWVNKQGQRFTNEAGYDRDILADLLQQEGNTYWMVFDEAGRDAFSARGAAWLKNPAGFDALLDDPEVTQRAGSIEELAGLAGLPADALLRSVGRFNELVAAGEDTDFGRFSSREEAPPPIAEPPFYAMRMFPMTRKNMGGVSIDEHARVLTPGGEEIAGLYAVGELTGSVGINGRYGLDGMFLGPAVLTGRLAGQDIASLRGAPPAQTVPASPLEEAPGDALPEMTAADAEALVALGRDGYWHFEASHRLVTERGYRCGRCHSAGLPYAPPHDRQAALRQAETCLECH